MIKKQLFFSLLLCVIALAGCQTKPAVTNLDPASHDSVKNALAARYKKAPSEIVLDIPKENAMSMRGTYTIGEQTKPFLASRKYNEWEIVMSEDKPYSCAAIAIYVFPKSFVPECYYDNDSKILAQLRSDTLIDFSDYEREVKFTWQTPEVQIELVGSSMRAENLSDLEKIKEIERSFEALQFVLDMYNLADGTIGGVAGYRLASENEVCLLEKRSTSEIDPLSPINVEIKCASLNRDK